MSRHCTEEFNPSDNIVFSLALTFGTHLSPFGNTIFLALCEDNALLRDGMIFTTRPEITGAREYIIIVMATPNVEKIVKYAIQSLIAREFCF